MSWATIVSGSEEKRNAQVQASIERNFRTWMADGCDYMYCDDCPNCIRSKLEELRIKDNLQIKELSKIRVKQVEQIRIKEQAEELKAKEQAKPSRRAKRNERNRKNKQTSIKN